MKSNNEIPVWDIFVRIFHWLLVVLFLLAFITGDEKKSLHPYIGYSIFGLVVSRFVWGFIGTKYARFSSFICSPIKGLTYIKELMSGTPKHYMGHNPAAAWMVIFFLLFSVVVCFSGYMAYAKKVTRYSSGFTSSLLVTHAYADGHGKERYGDKHNLEERHGKGDRRGGKRDGFWCEFHEVTARIMIFLIVIHVIGAAISSKQHNENLIKSMITGRKTAHPQ